MPEEKKPISKSSTVTIGILIMVFLGALSLGITFQKVNANEAEVKDLKTKVENLVTKDDLNKLESNLKELFLK